MPYKLPELPSNVQTLLNDESARLDRLRPDLPYSPDQCGTCLGRKRFLWWGRYPDSGTEKRPNEVVEYECPCDDQWILQRWLTIRGINDYHQRLGLDDASGVHTATAEVVLDYLTNWQSYASTGMGFVLHGDKGAGKTMLAMLMLKTLIMRGVDGYMATFAEALSMLRASWNDPADKDWFAARVRAAQVLVLDDIGREHQQQQLIAGVGKVRHTQSLSESMLDEVLRFRLSAGKPTFITSNHDLAKLGEHYGDNVLSLLCERSIVCEFRAEDYRSTAAQRVVAEVNQGLRRPVVLA